MKLYLEELTLVVGLILHVQSDELTCLIHNVYHEARGESFAGQVAVADVTLNRVKTNICDAVYAPKQFSWTNDGRPDEPQDFEAYQRAMLAAIYALTMPDSTGGADHFYAHKRVRPYWVSFLKTTAVIGNHTFMRSK